MTDREATTPTPEPVAPSFTVTDWSAFCNVRGCSIPFEHEHHGDVQPLRSYIVQTQAEIADLRGKLERAERELQSATDAAPKEAYEEDGSVPRVVARLVRDRDFWRAACNDGDHIGCALQAERDAATARADEAEHQRDIISASLDDCEALLAKVDSRATEAERLLRAIRDARAKFAVERLVRRDASEAALILAIADADKHLSTLPGSKESDHG